MAELNSAVTDRRRQTRSRVYNYIYRAETPRSKQDVARDLDLSMPTVYLNVDELLAGGLIEYCGQRQPDGGRPAMLMRAVMDAKTAVGIHIAAYCVRFVSTNLSGRELAYKEVPLRFSRDSVDYCLHLAGELEAFIDEAGIDRKTLLGVGVAIPGIAEPAQMKFHHAATLGGEEFSLQPFADEIDYPVYIENDATSSGFAEWTGSELDRNIAFLSLSDGVGGAVLVNGKPFFGNNNRSGEFGHMCVSPGGRQCNCGKRGCLEAYCSPRRLTTDLGISSEEFFTGLDSGNEEYAAIWDNFKTHLAVGIHNIRMALDSEVVLGGYLTEHLKPRMEEIRSAVSELDPFDTDCSYLCVSTNTRFSSMLGVAQHFINEFFQSL